MGQTLRFVEDMAGVGSNLKTLWLERHWPMLETTTEPPADELWCLLPRP